MLVKQTSYYVAEDFLSSSLPLIFDNYCIWFTGHQGLTEVSEESYYVNEKRIEMVNNIQAKLCASCLTRVIQPSEHRDTS